MPVSYTHLDVYKRQVLSLYKPPETPGPGTKRQQPGAGGFLAAAELARKSGKIL